MDVLFHVTYSGRLPFIAQEGLLPGKAPSIGRGPYYSSHRRGAVFLTEPEGLSFWHERAEEWAHHSADDLLEEGFIPVVLRIHAPEDCDLDELGTADAHHDAYRCTRPVPPEDIEIWDGEAWIAMEDYEDLDPSAAVDDEGYMVAFWDNALVPTETEWELNPISKERQREREQTQARLLAFLLEHGTARIRGGHVAMARRLAREGLVRVIALRPGHAAEIVPGKEEEARRFVEEHVEPAPNPAQLRRRLLR